MKKTVASDQWLVASEPQAAQYFHRRIVRGCVAVQGERYHARELALHDSHLAEVFLDPPDGAGVVCCAQSIYARRLALSGFLTVTREPQAALLEPPELTQNSERRTQNAELPELIAERRARLLRRQIDGVHRRGRREHGGKTMTSPAASASSAVNPEPAEPRWESPGLADWRAQQRSARRCAWLLGVLLIGGVALIGLAAIAAKLGWL